MNISYIKEVIPFAVRNGRDCDISGVAYARQAKENEIAIARCDEEIKLTAASVVLTELTMIDTNKQLLFPFDSLYEVAVVLAELFVAFNYYPDYSKMPEYKLINGNRIGHNCRISDTAVMGGFVSIGNDVVIGDRCVIEDSVFIGSGSVIGDDVYIRSGSRIGVSPFFQYGSNRYNRFSGLGKVIIGDQVSIGANSVIERGTFADTIIGTDVAIGHNVIIGHDSIVGAHSLIVTNTAMAGEVVIEKNVKIYGCCNINNNVTISHGSIIKGASNVWKDVASGEVISGCYGRRHAEELKIQAKLRRLILGGKRNGWML